jgi:hypothetical protein
MRSLLVTSLVISLVCGLLFLVAKRGAVMGDEGIPSSVNASDIPKKVKLIGRLGVRLGEDVVTVRGKWRSSEGDPTNEKSVNFSFVAASINGNVLRHPVELPLESVSPIMPRGRVVLDAEGKRKWVADWTTAKERLPKVFEGDEWEMTGFEIGGLHGCPAEIRKMYSYVQLWPCRFTTEFLFASMRVLGETKKHADNEGKSLTPEDDDDLKGATPEKAPWAPGKGDPFE